MSKKTHRCKSCGEWLDVNETHGDCTRAPQPRRWVCGGCQDLYGWQLAEPADDHRSMCEVCYGTHGWWLRPDYYDRLDDVLKALDRERKAAAGEIVRKRDLSSLAVKLLVAALRGGVGSGEIVHAAKACVRAAETVGPVLALALAPSQEPRLTALCGSCATQLSNESERLTAEKADTCIVCMVDTTQRRWVPRMRGGGR